MHMVCRVMSHMSLLIGIFCFLSRALSFLYPYGATLNVAKPAVAVLSTGSVCFPLTRPVCALYSSKVMVPSVSKTNVHNRISDALIVISL